jgi:hypothetical protein
MVETQIRQYNIIGEMVALYGTISLYLFFLSQISCIIKKIEMTNYLSIIMKYVK